MSGYLLDTNVISDIIRNPSGSAALRAEKESQSICTSIIVAAELRYGCEKKGSARLWEKVESLLSIIPVVGLDVPVDRTYGSIRVELEMAGLPIGHNDLLIAAHARTLDLTLVTANLSEFERVRGLKVENWVSPQ